MVNMGCRFGDPGIPPGAPVCFSAMRNDRALVALAIVVGIALIAIAFVYWLEPAKSLPGFFPGHTAGSSHHHAKHGIASFLVGLACLAFAWFRTGPGRARAT
jgi:hypothetical protein